MPTAAPSFSELFRTFGRIGLINFGGPAGQIALMHRELVEERKWVSENDYLHALNFCHLLPGPEAQQLATYIGWKLHGVRGGLAAGLLFILPGALVMLVLSIFYAFAAHLQWFAALFLGVKAAVLAIVVQALIRIAGRALKTQFQKLLAAAAFVGLFVFSLPFPLIILSAGALGMVFGPKSLEVSAVVPSAGPDWRGTIKTVLVWLIIWAAPMALIAATLGQANEFWKIGVFFSKLAVVTFGGAYAVLAYMAQEAVHGFHWLRPGEMVDGLGLAETTPGPLIMVSQFVGFLAAFRAPAPFSPLIAGVIGAILTTWVTFAPCFLWIFTCAPWIERLQHARRLKNGLAAVTAAVVGVIANLTVWFAVHVLFLRTSTITLGAFELALPDPASLDWRAASLALLAALLLFRIKLGVIKVLGLACLGGFALSFV